MSVPDTNTTVNISVPDQQKKKNYSNSLSSDNTEIRSMNTFRRKLKVLVLNNNELTGIYMKM